VDILIEKIAMIGDDCKKGIILKEYREVDDITLHEEYFHIVNTHEGPEFFYVEDRKQKFFATMLKGKPNTILLRVSLLNGSLIWEACPKEKIDVWIERVKKEFDLKEVSLDIIPFSEEVVL